MSRNSERKELRRHFRAKRRALSRRDHLHNSLDVARNIRRSGLILRSQRIGCYWANDAEVDLSPVLARLAQCRKFIALPCIGSRGYMNFAHYSPGIPMVINRYGIAEPGPEAAHVDGRSLNVVLAPLVAFDDYGVRLGMGAGYYDRYMSRLPPLLRPQLVGVAHEVQRSPDPLPFDHRDVPLDAVLTERGWQTFH